MITRGAFIGEIIDELSTIAEQVKLRNTMGYTDLSVFAENFYRDILNVLLNAKLQNLNADRSNEPGLDLGDRRGRIAFQVTASASTKKVNETLAKLGDDEKAAYDRIVILAIGKSQGSYSIDPVLAKEWNFSEENIWGVTEIARQAVALEIEPLDKLVRLIRANVVKVRVELEVPDKEGKYPTNGFDKWEPRPDAKVGSGAGFFAYFTEEGHTLEDDEKAKIKPALDDLARRLSRTPRVTREFLAVLFERADEWNHHHDALTYLLSKAEREFHGDDLRGELDLLEHERLIRLSIPHDHDDRGGVIILDISKNRDLSATFADYVVKRGLTFRNVLGQVDLSAF